MAHERAGTLTITGTGQQIRDARDLILQLDADPNRRSTGNPNQPGVQKALREFLDAHAPGVGPRRAPVLGFAIPTSLPGFVRLVTAGVARGAALLACQPGVLLQFAER